MKIKDLNNTIINSMIMTGTVIDCKEGYMEVFQQNYSEPTLTISVPSTVTVGTPTTITVTASVVGDITVYINQEYYQTSIGQSTMSFTYTPQDTFTIEAYFSSTQEISVNASQEVIPEGALSFAVQSFDRYRDNYNPAFQYYLYNVAGIAANETYTTQDEADAVTTLTEPIFRRTEYLEDPTSIPYTYFIGSDIDNKTRVDKIPFTSLDELDNFSNLTELDNTIFAAYDGETSGDNKIWNGVQVQSYRFPDSLERLNIVNDNPAHQGLVSLKFGGNVRVYENNVETAPYSLMTVCGFPSHIEMSGDIDTTIDGVNLKMFVRDNVVYGDIPMSGIVARVIMAVKNNVDTDEFTPYLSPMSMLYFIGNGSSDDIYIKYSNANIMFTGVILGYNNTIHLRNDIDAEITIGDPYGSQLSIMDYNTYTPIPSTDSNIDINSLSQGTIIMSRIMLNNTSLSIPANLKGFKLESNAEMPYLTSLTISPDNTYVSYSDGFLVNYDGTTTYFPSLVSNISTMDVPEGVQTLPSNFMNGNTNLEEVTLPSTLTTVPSHAFYNCFNLAELNISEGTTILGQEAFTNADALTTLTLPSTLRTINYQALAGLNSLTELVVPEGVTTTESGAFMINTSLYTLDLPSTFNRLGYYSLESSDSLKNIILRNPTPPAMYGGIAIKYHINGHDSEGGARALSSYDLFVPDASVSAYQADSNWGQLNVRPLSEYVRTEPFYINLTIGNNKHFALDSNTQFVVNNTTLNIPSQLESMDVRNITFPNLTNVVVAEDNTHFAFFNGILYCDGNVVIDTNPPVPQTYACQSTDPNGVNYNPALQEYLYDSGIASNSGYTTTTEALNLTEIEARGLEGKTNLTDLYALSNFPNLVRISNNAFRNCTNLLSADIPSSVTYLGATAFEGCTRLGNCYMDRSQIDNIHASTFVGCSEMTTVVLPSTLTYIGEWAFHNCTNLIVVQCEATTPPEVYSGAFDDKSNIRLYVPSASISAYQNSTYWQGFRSYNAI